MEWSCLVACSVYGHGPGAARGKQGSGNSRVPQSQQLCHFLAAMVTEMPRSHCLQVWSRPSPWQRASRARLTPRLLGLHLKAGELSSAKGKRLKVSLRDGSPPPPRESAQKIKDSFEKALSCLNSSTETPETVSVLR